MLVSRDLDENEVAMCATPVRSALSGVLGRLKRLWAGRVWFVSFLQVESCFEGAVEWSPMNCCPEVFVVFGCMFAVGSEGLSSLRFPMVALARRKAKATWSRTRFTQNSLSFTLGLPKCQHHWKPLG